LMTMLPAADASRAAGFMSLFHAAWSPCLWVFGYSRVQEVSRSRKQQGPQRPKAGRCVCGTLACHVCKCAPPPQSSLRGWGCGWGCGCGWGWGWGWGACYMLDKFAHTVRLASPTRRRPTARVHSLTQRGEHYVANTLTAVYTAFLITWLPFRCYQPAWSALALSSLEIRPLGAQPTAGPPAAF
jgi:hypothetical protein